MQPLLGHFGSAMEEPIDNKAIAEENCLSDNSNND